MSEGHNVIQIIDGCIRSDRESQQEFYTIFYGFAMGVCVRYCNSKDSAMEVVNDGFLKVFNQLHKFTPSHENYELSLKGWMKRVMVNTAIDHFRKNNKHQLLVDMDDTRLEITDNLENSLDRMSYKEIMEVVQKLSPVYRTVFNLYVIDGFKHEEIAQQLNISVGTSKSNLAKARVNIQKMLMKANFKVYEQKAV